MKRKGKIIIAALLLVMIAGCGKYMLPNWVVELGGYRWSSTAFASRDNEALFLLSRLYNQDMFLVEKFDLQGSLIKEYSIPLPNEVDYPNHLVRTAENAFYVVRNSLETITYSDPDTAVSWVGVEHEFPPNQRPFLRHALANDDGDLVVLVRVRTEIDGADPVWSWAVGLVGRDGVFRSFTYVEDVGAMSDLHKNEHGGFDVKALLPQQADGSYPEDSVFLEFDMYGTLLNRTVRSTKIYSIGYAQGRWLGVQGDESGVFDGSGELILKVDFDFARKFLDAPGGFYAFGYVSSSPGVQGESSTSRSRTPKVCFYDAEFLRRWCKTLTDFTSSKSDYSDRVQVGEDGRLLFSRELDSLRLSGGVLEIDAIANKVAGNFDIRGEESRRLKHLLIDTDGRSLLQAQAEPYYHRGIAYLCPFFAICISEETVHPGFGGEHTTVLLPDMRIYSFVKHTIKEWEEYNGQLLYWGPQ